MKAAVLIVGVAAAGLAAAARGRALELAGVGAALEDLVGLGPDAQELYNMTFEPNVRAFSLVVRTGEGTAGKDGYRTLFGGGLFHNLADHPRIRVTRPLAGSLITSTAAGAYQILERTWDDGQRVLKLPDFSVESQDAFFVWLLRRRGALEDVRAGRFDAAIAKASREWASLPGSPYGQPMKTIDQVRAVYAAAGGVFA